MSTSGETPAFIPVDHADELRADIVNTRAELADTLDHLMAKLDVKSQARHRLDDVKSATQERMSRLPEPVQQAAAEVGKLAQRARPYRKQIAIAVGSLLFVVVVTRRIGS